MDEFIERQFRQLRFQVADYRAGRLCLGSLIARIEGLAEAIGGSFWHDDVWPIVRELELINSELIDQGRLPSTSEGQEIDRVLRRLGLLLGAESDDLK